MEAKITGDLIRVTAKNAVAISNDLMNGSLTLEQLSPNPFRVILYYSLVPMDFLEKYWDKFTTFDKVIISNTQNLTEDFMEKHRDELCWRSICRYQTLTEQFMISMSDYLDWEMVWAYQTKSEDFIFRYKEVCEHWVMKYGKYVNDPTVRLGKLPKELPEDTDEYIKKVESVNQKKKQKRKPNDMRKIDNYKKHRGRDLYSYSDML